jgi:hypothetical protein
VHLSIAIDDVVEKAAVDAGRVQENGSFCGGGVAGDALPVCLE